MKICLNMIVKNESKIIKRALDSVKNQLTCYAICDTGSTDNTIDIIKDTLKDLPGTISVIKFTDFSQARNEALDIGMDVAKKCNCDYLLLIDADMELKGTIPSELNKECYLIIQVNDILQYENARLLKVGSLAKYRCPTHEYLSYNEMDRLSLKDVYLIDHNDGNHENKLLRDKKLLEDELIKNNTPRCMFYLARTYHDIGEHENALKLFEAKIKLGGWPEEIFMSYMIAASSYKFLNDIGSYIRMLEKAIKTNSNRAEPYCELAEFYMAESNHTLAWLYANQALSCKIDRKFLFCDTSAYTHRPLFVLSVIGYYMGDEKKRLAIDYSNYLALSRNVPGGTKWKTLTNYKFYSPICTFNTYKELNIDINVSDGVWGQHNPSIVQFNNKFIINVRSGNYHYYSDNGVMRSKIYNGNKILNNNYICEATTPNDKWELKNSIKYKDNGLTVMGLEDIRLFVCNGVLYGICACFDYATKQGTSKQALLRYDSNYNIDKITPLLYKESPDDKWERNWAPLVIDNEMYCVYKYEPFTVLKINKDTGVCTKHFEKCIFTDKNLSDFRGSSQLIEIDGKYWFVVHVISNAPSGVRGYYHRVCAIDKTFTNLKMTNMFSFSGTDIEFCAGLTYYNNKLYFTFGKDDRTAHIGCIDKVELEGSLG